MNIIHRKKKTENLREQNKMYNSHFSLINSIVYAA